MIIIVRIVFVEYNDINLDFDVCGDDHGDDHDQIVSWGKLSDNREYFTPEYFPMSTNDISLPPRPIEQLKSINLLGKREKNYKEVYGVLLF